MWLCRFLQNAFIFISASQIYFYVRECFACISVSAHSACSALRGQKRKLELQTVVSYHVGAENQIQVLCALKHWATSPVPVHWFVYYTQAWICSTECSRLLLYHWALSQALQIVSLINLHLFCKFSWVTWTNIYLPQGRTLETYRRNNSVQVWHSWSVSLLGLFTGHRWLRASCITDRYCPPWMMT